jgi:alpha-D-ribose 1-methylphosphonate 5-triphosphate synthase subunit PhnH
VEVEGNFRKILEGVARPGVVVKVVKDATAPGPTGVIHTLVYGVSRADNAGHGNLDTLLTAEKTGGAFQATLQAAKYGNAP